MNAIHAIAAKEIRDGLRNRWVLATSLLLAARWPWAAGQRPTGSVKVDPLTVTVVSLSSLSIFLVPLIAMLLAYDAIVGEADRGTLALLLSYPVARWQVMAGKFAGHLVILALATGAGYGFAGLALQWLHGGGLDAAAWRPFALLIGASVLLGASFLALGYLVSAAVRERATAAGIAVGVWLFFVVIYDMALLGALAADQGRHIGRARSTRCCCSTLGRVPAAEPHRLRAHRDVRRRPAWAIRPACRCPRWRWRCCCGSRRRCCWRRRYSEPPAMKTLRTLLAAATAALALAACRDETPAAPPAPRIASADAVGYYCGMVLNDHAGPKGQIFVRGRWTGVVLVDQAGLRLHHAARGAQGLLAVYVNDMATAGADGAPDPPCGSTRARPIT